MPEIGPHRNRPAVDRLEPSPSSATTKPGYQRNFPDCGLPHSDPARCNSHLGAAGHLVPHQSHAPPPQAPMFKIPHSPTTAASILYMLPSAIAPPSPARGRSVLGTHDL